MKAFTYCVMFCIFLLSANFVCAIGITGGNLLRNKEIFHPNEVFEFGYALIGSKTYTNSYDIYAKDELAQYVTFDGPTRFEDIPAGTTIPFSGQINFPESLEPGMHYTHICVLEDCPGGGGNACGRTSACAQLGFMAFYPGIYPIVAFIVYNVNQDIPINFTAQVHNLGKDTIQQATGMVKVLNLREEEVGTATFESKKVETNAKAVISAVFDTDGLPPGNYTARAFIDCDGQESVHNRTFRIGDLVVRIVNYTEEMEARGIRRFTLTAESEWNDPLDIFIELALRGPDGNAVVSRTTETKSLEPWQTVEFETFLDLTEAGPGEYDIRLTAHFAGYKKVEEGRIILTAPPEPVEKEAEKETAGLNMTVLTVVLVAVVLLLTFVNIFLVVYKKKKD